MTSDRPFRSRTSVPADEGEATRITNLATLEDELRSRQHQRAAYLVVLQGSNVGEMHRLEGPETVIGRSAATTLRLNDEGISRRHCRVISVSGGGFVLEDLGSANGTLVNGAMVQQHVLAEGDKISLGATTMLKFTNQDELDESFQQQMIDAALRDGLTRAYNKKFFMDRLETEFAYASRHKTLLSLVMFDVDFFKRINDTYGHLAGDAVLVRLSSLSQSTIRTEDVLARYGGEEFAVICRGIELINAGVLGERLRVRVEQESFEYDGTRLPVTISVGIAAISPGTTASPVDLIRDADSALYEAKRSGRNRVCLHGL
jgi:two-component system cell cycle response regulator